MIIIDTGLKEFPTTCRDCPYFEKWTDYRWFRDNDELDKYEAVEAGDECALRGFLDSEAEVDFKNHKRYRGCPLKEIRSEKHE